MEEKEKQIGLRRWALGGDHNHIQAECSWPRYG